ncbi:acyloxyacyl hydrolase [Desulfobulbus sp.]|uniref:acyloxyacyl hydrolase n=1 Tax=Desulfobulbus sp. TaxID=895 RepID=UPI00286EBE5A|nr:acyloxyacyl hydrolase [Desulfobulbus sp.]
MIAPASTAFSWETSKDAWALLGGYGQSISGWGQTTQRVRTFDLVPRYDHMTVDNLGSGWLKGFHSTLIELPVHVVTSPDSSLMVGINLLACYTFTAAGEWQPYIFGGGGPVYSFADIPGMGAKWNGNYQFALGLKHPLDATRAWLLEIRYHHISNAGTEEPNEPLNSIKFLAGMTF